ncbi:hypothetical protein [Actinoplanes sp. G11-F43]|uniref:hypothetical protein n=1 Tax=Actinoplanes sp. G11-F43 TaxID=3424130 RepID=UPI003D32EB6A
MESCDTAPGRSAEQPSGDAQDALTMPLLGDGFQPVAAVICAVGTRERPGGGTEIVASESRATGLGALLAGLRLPDATVGAEVCTMDLPSVPWLVLVDADGRWIRPGVPIDECGKPRTEYREAFYALTTTEVSSRVIGLAESDGAASSGCAQTWGDMAWAMGGTGNDFATTLAPLPATTTVQRCVYFVPEAERGTAKPAGDFRAGGPMPAAEWTVIRAEIEASAPASAACATPASGFAVLQFGGGGILYVEKDGCRRILVEPPTGSTGYRQSSDRLTTILFG